MAKRKAKETKVKAEPPKKTKRAKVAAAETVVLSGETTAQREERNGVKRPRQGGLCAAVWTDLDKLLASGSEPTTAQVKDLATARGWNTNNATAELSAWRKFNGLSRSVIKEPKKKRSSAAKLAGLPRMSAEEVIPYTA
jgi:hypothetical protein